MSDVQKSKGAVFKDLHAADGIFVMPNAWNAGSACMLEAAGFPAVGTTSPTFAIRPESGLILGMIEMYSLELIGPSP